MNDVRARAAGGTDYMFCTLFFFLFLFILDNPVHEKVVCTSELCILTSK
jgi:hypothetical protein